MKVLLEELSSYKAGKESEEEFPDLLLSSLDKLYADKQQQLWLVSAHLLGSHQNKTKFNLDETPAPRIHKLWMPLCAQHSFKVCSDKQSDILDCVYIADVL